MLRSPGAVEGGFAGLEVEVIGVPVSEPGGQVDAGLVMEIFASGISESLRIIVQLLRHVSWPSSLFGGVLESPANL